jgi:hypothetical protein
MVFDKVCVRERDRQKLNKIEREREEGGREGGRGEREGGRERKRKMGLYIIVCIVKSHPYPCVCFMGKPRLFANRVPVT